MRKITKEDVLWYLVEAECQMRDMNRLRPDVELPMFSRAYALVRKHGPELVEVEEESGG